MISRRSSSLRLNQVAHLSLLLLSAVGFLSAVASAQKTYVSVDFARNVHSRVPRFSSLTSLSNVNQGNVGSYAVGVGSTAAWGGVLFILSLLAGIWIFCAACCTCCGSKGDFKVKLSKKQKVLWMSGLLVLLILISIFAIVGLTNNTTVHTVTADDNQGFIAIMKGFINDIKNFIYNIFNILGQILDGVSLTVSKINFLVNRFSQALKDGVNPILTALDTLSSSLTSGASGTVGSGQTSYTYNCTLCYNLAATVTSVKNEIQSVSSTTINSINNTVNQLTGQISSQETTIRDTLSSANSTLNSFLQSGYVGSISTSLDLGQSYVTYYEARRNGLTITLLLIPLFAVVVLFVAAVMNKKSLFTCNACNLWCAWFFMSILLAVHLPLAVLLSDGCIYLDDHETSQSYNSLINNADAERVLNACFDNTGLGAALNITDKVAFINQNWTSQIPSTQDVTNAFNFPLLESFKNLTDAINTGDVINFTLLNESITVFNQQPTNCKNNTGNWDNTNVLNATLVSNNLTCLVANQTFLVIQNLLTAKTTADNKIAEIKQNLVNVIIAVSNVKGNITILVVSF
eukprot:TRINITY_DN6397_c0_g1_i4.p1 TRINITY_DN6397_c0_g1~~TRINITY_DN6397_c0_g1_i4.p1  ORF type:complete len:574 (-),score=129.01 TRINITY_DN6397_c0_g1_i4:36-1757(-)